MKKKYLNIKVEIETDKGIAMGNFHKFDEAIKYLTNERDWKIYWKKLKKGYKVKSILKRK